MKLEYAINPRRIGIILGILALYFAAQSLVVEYVQDQVADSDVNDSFILAIDLFSVNAEQTIPTWYAATNLFVAAVVLWLITAAKRASRERYVRYWAGLATGFVYLSVDEGAVIHEVLADWMQTEFQFTGYLAFAWQVVAVPLVIVLGLLYLRFVFHLPVHTRNRLIAAGVLYVGGTVLLDAVSANQWDADGAITLRYLAIGTLEELCEMLGVVLLIYTLLAYIVEMRYAFAFQPLSLAQDTSETTPHNSDVRAHASRNMLQSLSLRRTLMGIGALIVGLNLALLYWASVQEPAPRSANLNPGISIPMVIDQFVADDVVVTRMPGGFIDNPASHQLVASLLPQFDQVIVVTSASTNSSFALAADEFQFDRSRLAEVLQAYGEIQFVIFDAPAVEAIVGNVPAGTQTQ